MTNLDMLRTLDSSDFSEIFISGSVFDMCCDECSDTCPDNCFECFKNWLEKDIQEP